MSIACPADLNTAVLPSEISSIYGRVAAAPDGECHFHRSPAYAAEFLGYDAKDWRAFPRTVRHPSPALATRTQSVQFTLVKPYWISVVGLAWTCCLRPSGWDRRAMLLAWT